MGVANRFFVELRRRRVLRVAGMYIVGSWVVLQVADLAFESFGLPGEALSYVWLAAFVGFPLALVFSWRYDLTPAGIVRTLPAEEGDRTDLSLRRADYLILAALAVMAAAILTNVVSDIRRVDTSSLAREAGAVLLRNTIAVLPLENLSGSPDQEYLAAGMHDALITSLSKIAGLRVISRTSTVRVDDTLTLPGIGRTLGAGKIVEGSVTREGDRVRIIVQLIDSESDAHLWAESYERQFAGLLTLQNEMARDIARAIEVQLSPDEAKRLARKREVNPATYEAYLRGMFQLHKDTQDGFARGMEILHAAVEDDPASALAYAGLAYGYGKIGHSFFPDRSANPRLRYTARRALELDDTLAEAHLGMGMYQLYSEWDWPAAEASLRRAIELNPSLVLAHYHYAWLLELLGRDDEAIAAGELTEQLDPLSPFFAGWLADQYRDAGRFDEAIRHANMATDLNPHFPVGWYVLGNTLAEVGRYDEAIEAHGRLQGMPFWSWARAYSFALAGRVDEAFEIARAVEAEPQNAIPLVLVNGILNDDEAFFAALVEARDGNYPWYPWLVVWFTGLEHYHDDPRIREMATQLALDFPSS